MPDLDKPENAAPSGTPPAADPEERADGCALVYATFPSIEVAEEIGGALVDARLAACVNILPGMVSIYRWQGERHRDPEVSMIAKTRAGLVERVIEAVRASHPYTNPALLVVPVVGGSRQFLEWIAEETERPAG